MGERTQAFESAFARQCRSKYAYAVSSGTAALHLAVLGLGIKPGDEIILPSLTFVACANVILAAGAKPVFADLCGEDDWTLSPQAIEEKITENTKAILVVHYAGFPCRMREIQDLASQHNLFVIEDCAHALFSEYDDKSCGCIGDAGCFSFFSNKNMTTGEGGMLTTQNDEIAERVRILRSHGMTSLTLDRHKGRAISYDVSAIGLNYRIDEMRSALGLNQLAKLDGNLHKRRQVYNWYANRLQDRPGLSIPFLKHSIEKTGIHIFPILLKETIDRNSFIQALKTSGIQTSIHYPAIHRFSAYKELLQESEIELPVTEAVAMREVTLPFFPAMSEKQVEFVCEAVRSAITSQK